MSKQSSNSLKTGFLIGGSSSGVGKTTVTLAITAAALRRGHVVQPFKGGPDYLDAGHQTLIAGRASRNLDTWMLSHEANRELFRKAARGADVLIAEGMMGLFDGKHGDTGAGSSAEIAALLQLPVILVVDASNAARSIAALVLGFELFDPSLSLAGVILNRVASERHFEMLAAAILSRCRTPVLGWLPREASIAIPERHLGLQSAEEQPSYEHDARLEVLAGMAERHLDLDRIFSLRCGLALAELPSTVSLPPCVRIGVARDAAFTFYYEDNLDLLREQGAEIVSFSPIKDSRLPESLDALYLGGGYPELHGQELSSNQPMLQAIRTFAASGRPIYAECGGMMYLTRSLIDKDGVEHKMAGVLSFSVAMTNKLVRFGYVTVEFTRDCILGAAGTSIRGHSFHHSRILPARPGSAPASSVSYLVRYSLSGQQEEEGFSESGTNVLASYIHLHFRANTGVAQNFVAAALAVSSRSPATAPNLVAAE